MGCDCALGWLQGSTDQLKQRGLSSAGGGTDAVGLARLKMVAKLMDGIPIADLLQSKSR